MREASLETEYIFIIEARCMGGAGVSILLDTPIIFLTLKSYFMFITTYCCKEYSLERKVISPRTFSNVKIFDDK